MNYDRDFLRVTLADFLVRAAYQMGKTPLLPIFAAMLGADDVLLGLIVSISTMTGMLAKPIVGFLSDRWGRQLWLLIGTAFFGIVPFFYWGVTTPAQLIVIRVIHGTATAIYGPVTLAFVAERTVGRRAERLGWFGNAKSAGYIVGPLVGGFLLLSLSPQWIFTIIGIVSCLAFIPIVGLEELVGEEQSADCLLPQHDRRRGLQRAWSSQFSAIWIAGGIDALTYVALYALRTFLPIYALGVGFNSAEIGTFFAFQAAAAIIAKPSGGRFADRYGYSMSIVIGMVGITFVLPLIPLANVSWLLLLLAIALGIFQGLLFPATTALIAQQVDRHKLGMSMGVAGTLSNAGKVAGPLIGGVLLARLSYQQLFIVLSTTLLVAAFAIYIAFGRWGARQVGGLSAD